MRLLHLVFLFFYISLSTLFAQPLEKVTLQLQWKHQFEFAGFYAAKEKGFYKDLGLDVEFKEFESGMNITDEVLSQRAQYATSYSSIVLDYLEKKPIVLLANFFKQSPIVLVTQKSIKTPKDLKDKKVMGLLDSTHNQTLLLMLEKFNLSKNDFTNINRSFVIDSFVQKEIDAISAFTTNEIFSLDQLGIDYNILDPAAYGIKFYDNNLFTSQIEFKQNPQRVEAFRKASIKGWKYALRNKQEIIDLILKKYNTQNKTKESLLFEARQIEYLMLTNVYPIGSVDMRMVESIADGYIQMHPDKNLDKSNLNTFVYLPRSQELFFNEKQKEYLKNKKVIKMCVDPKWMPLEMIEEEKYIGIAADVMQNISKEIQTPIKLIPTHSWSQSLQKIKNKECDILAMAEKTPKREEYLNFTTPYVQMPLVIATKIGVPFINDFSNIKEKKLGVVSNYSMIELLKQKYKGINLVQVNSVEDGLKQVRKKKLFGFLDNALVINHDIQKNNYEDITISGQFEYLVQLSIASRKDEPILNQIMEKALLSLDANTINNIINQWKNIKYQKQYNYELITKIFSAVLILIGIFTYWLMRLKEEIRKKDEAQIKLKVSEERFRTLFDIAPIMIDAFDSNGKVLLWNKECEKVFGWEKEELLIHDDPLSLFYPDPNDKKRVLESMEDDLGFREWREWHPTTKDGNKIITMWANIDMPNGEIIHIGRDITAYRKHLNELNEKTQELEDAKQKLQNLNNTLEARVNNEIEKNLKHQVLLLQKNRLAQMGEMIENIAHQWRQPLAQINSCILILDAFCNRENKLKEPLIKEKFHEIESMTAFMSNTIDDFKNFFNPDKKKDIFSLYEAVENAFKIVAEVLKVNYIEVAFTVDESLKANNYMQELEHVLIIIFNNAKDALLTNKVKKPKITISSSEDDEFVKLLLCDNGGGIEPEYLEKIFEPYFTTKHKTQGTGLGLYMAKMIIEEGLKGKLIAFNQENGACFEIYLPKEINNG